MVKIKGLALDFDEVMVETIDAIVSIINEDYNLNADPKNVNKWNFEDVFPNVPIDKINEAFEDKRFFERVKLKSNLIETLSVINKNYPIIIVTAGTRKNLILKQMFVSKKINSIGITTKFFGFIHGIEDKSDIDLTGFLFVDDNQNNLKISNASVKILFENRKDADWNNNWNGLRIKDISEILKYFN